MRLFTSLFWTVCLKVDIITATEVEEKSNQFYLMIMIMA